MFDRVNIYVKAGDGGDGAITFRREKFVPFGGPDGGDGGNGGNVILKADRSVENLLKYRRKRHFRAENGEPGARQKKHGKNGGDLTLAVPVGTIVREQDEAGSALLADLSEDGREVVIARGGKGGWGNTRYASSTNQAPQIAQSGSRGEETSVDLEVRLIADVGIVGYPNAGKSTLLAAVSHAHPKIAGYPFTTLEPALGVVDTGTRSFVMAEIPGLIAGAHEGKGLGHDFLQHVTRTRVLLHLVDAATPLPLEDFAQVNRELVLYDTELARKPQIVALNKIDLPEAGDRLARLKEDFKKAGMRVYPVSAEKGEGVRELVAAVGELLDRVMAEQPAEDTGEKVFRPQPEPRGHRVRREGDVYVVDIPELARLRSREGQVSAELRQQLRQQFARMGVLKALESAGIKPGDRVRCGALEWEW
ncbi:MAG: GTPase ObgE [Chloroflexota bacterium]